MIKHIRNSFANALRVAHKPVVLLFSIMLLACNNNTDSEGFSISNVVGPTSQRTANASTISFTLTANKVIENAELTFSLVAVEDSSRSYTVASDSLSLSPSGVAVKKTFFVPEVLENGQYNLNLTIDEVQQAQGVITTSQTLSIYEMTIITPEKPELNIKSAQLSNNSFTLNTPDNEQSEFLTKKGDFLLDLVLQSKYKAITGDVVLGFILELDTLGEFPLNLTSDIYVRNANSTDNHRNVTSDGKVLQRRKGQSRVLKERCIDVGKFERCVTIGKNHSRHSYIDLHLTADIYHALSENAQDVTGNIIITVQSDQALEDIELKLPIIYLYDNNAQVIRSKGLSLSRSLKEASASSSENQNDIDVVQKTVSGDEEYIYHETISSANTFTESDGQAYSEQSQEVKLSMGYQEEGEGQTFSMASMTTSVKSDESEDVNDTDFSLGLDSSGQTVWDFSEEANELSSTNHTQLKNSPQYAAIRSANVSTDEDTYNPQNEMTWLHCSNHKDICDLTGFVEGSTQVRYGSVELNKWNYKFVSDTVKCNDDNFGDPAKGEDKTCQYLPPPSFAPKWSRCANEGEACDLGSDAKAIRYGSNSAWNQMFTAGIVNCDDSTFGDPRKGKDKWCEVMTSAGTTPLNYEWVPCGDASDGDTCEVGSSAVVRIGTSPDKAGDFYSFLNVRTSIQCKDKHFGDPIDANPDKKCDYLSYIDPASRQSETDLIWSTKDESIRPNTDQSNVTEVAGEEKALVEVEFSKGMKFSYYGLTLAADIKVSGAVGLKSSAFVDTANKTFTLTGGPFVDVDSKATGKVYDALKITEVGIKAPLAVLDIYSPFTIALTVKPGTLTAELSLDYFLDLLAGEVLLYYEYSLWPYEDSDDEVIYQWNYLYQITDNIYKGSQTWQFTPVQDYIIPAIPDGFFEQALSISKQIEGRSYYLELAGSLVNNDVWDPENPNESVLIDLVCANDVIKSYVLTGQISESIELEECTSVIVSGIRATNWLEGNGLSLGIRER
ncbi:hypothetical protein RC083_04020 [Pseudoalteromonas haloplanktis]|uniref:Lipoprotein n=1 Tax=Pseudoalteromonas haloplanktis TaxID=228 RepID=A0ABU1B893_PSEHA|nr:hypothetical protein [Pseudoalteromonas haloplanktis]MDQ9090758.1 hypothetical protein [Pseudoalteromonas haloplanktis]